VPKASGHVFMFCAPGLVFGGCEGFRSRFHVLRSQAHFRRYRERRVTFSCFALTDSFFRGIEGVRSLFHVLHARTHFRYYRGCQVPFSCFACPDSLYVVPRASGPVFMFCAPGNVFDGAVGVRSCFHVLRARTHFRRYRGCRVPFFFFLRPDSLSAVPRASGPVFMFCAPGLVFGGCEGVGSRFHVLRSQARFRRYRERRVTFSCFALKDSFSEVSRASGPVFMFCAPGLIFDDIVGVGSRLDDMLDQLHGAR
jgi:hypothetical protein